MILWANSAKVAQPFATKHFPREAQRQLLATHKRAAATNMVVGRFELKEEFFARAEAPKAPPRRYPKIALAGLVVLQSGESLIVGDTKVKVHSSAPCGRAHPTPTGCVMGYQSARNHAYCASPALHHDEVQ
jgi:hypothetical protein